MSARHSEGDQTLSSSNNSSSWEVYSEKNIEAKSEPKANKTIQPDVAVAKAAASPGPSSASTDPPKLEAKASDSANVPKMFKEWDLDNDVPPPPLRDLPKLVAKASANVPTIYKEWD